VINLFVAPVTGAKRRATIEQVQGFNTSGGGSRSDLGFWAVSDIGPK